MNKEKTLKEIVNNFSNIVGYIANYDYNFEALDVNDLKSLYNFYKSVKELIYDDDIKDIKLELQK